MQDILVASRPTLLDAAEKIGSCQGCDPACTIEFGLIINFVRDLNPREVLFHQTDPVLCPVCSGEIWEHTLVSFYEG